MVREMKDSDWTRVAEIYTQGLLAGNATFNTECPTFAEWDRIHHKNCRFVYETDGYVVGWTALAPTSYRPVYQGVAELSLYIDEAYRGRGIGKQLLMHQCRESEKAGYYSLYVSIFSINAASLAVHKKCGFREVGYRERIARDRFGNWQDTTIMEHRIPDKE